jgi:hypothetical protein
MKTKAKTLALVPASSALGNLPATQPPPRKADIICALVERARVKHEEERQKVVAQIQEATKKIQAACIEELSKNPAHFEVSCSTYSNSFRLEYYAKCIPPHIARLIQAERSIPRLRSFDPAQVKRDITAKLSGGIAGDRVKALLASADAVKKLDATLEALSI